MSFGRNENTGHLPARMEPPVKSRAASRGRAGSLMSYWLMSAVKVSFDIIWRVRLCSDCGHQHCTDWRLRSSRHGMLCVCSVRLPTRQDGHLLTAASSMTIALSVQITAWSILFLGSMHMGLRH